eukprot:TRINITY_DN40761_c0_g1_i2.p1 TRINITY_DN40761_c0_g1~~TRINITY_DN40761_c0_g1_i2.p1  ORF type:complete len:170 (-),score=8.81 TRINITY_DN40761_c0_g1_i2:437-946(-)
MTGLFNHHKAAWAVVEGAGSVSTSSASSAQSQSTSSALVDVREHQNVPAGRDAIAARVDRLRRKAGLPQPLFITDYTSKQFTHAGSDAFLPAKARVSERQPRTLNPDRVHLPYRCRQLMSKIWVQLQDDQDGSVSKAMQDIYPGLAYPARRWKGCCRSHRSSLSFFLCG